MPLLGSWSLPSLSVRSLLPLYPSEGEAGILSRSIAVWPATCPGVPNYPLLRVPRGTWAPGRRSRARPVGSPRRERQYTGDEALDRAGNLNRTGNLSHAVRSSRESRFVDHLTPSLPVGSGGHPSPGTRCRTPAQDISVFVDELIELANGQPHRIAVAIERPHGGLGESFLERGLHVCSLSLKQLDRFRDRHKVAEGKDDRWDAYLLADALRTDRARFRSVDVDQPLVLQIRELCRAYEDLRGGLNRLTNRFRDQVHRCALHLLQLCASGDKPWFWELVERPVGSNRWTRVQRCSVAVLLKRHRIRRWDPDQVLAVLREPSISIAPGAAEAVQLHIDLVLPRLRVVHEQRKRCTKELQRPVWTSSPTHMRATDLAMSTSCGPFPLSVSSSWEHCSPKPPPACKAGCYPRKHVVPQGLVKRETEWKHIHPVLIAPHAPSNRHPNTTMHVPKLIGNGAASSQPESGDNPANLHQRFRPSTTRIRPERPSSARDQA